MRRVADNIIHTTTFQFVNNKTGEKFESTKGKDTSNNVKAEVYGFCTAARFTVQFHKTCVTPDHP